MICLKDNLPVIQLASGQAIAFERDWLVRSLTQAAARAGYAKWWLAAHVAESVTEFLRDQPELNVLPVERLTAAVRSVLQVIGYAVWMLVISRENLGVAVALCGAGFYLLMALAAWFIHGESLAPMQWVGIAFITIGVLCVSLKPAT